MLHPARPAIVLLVQANFLEASLARQNHTTLLNYMLNIPGRDIHGYETRGRDNYPTGRHRTVVYEHLPSQASKARLKRFLVSKAFYSVDEFLSFNWETAQFDD
ncbi:hypothetical protein J6590_050228 [Homalodisca vitripennis]|nr:hypothetical protein J6590_050228 [Homalodisca vitripennis]